MTSSPFLMKRLSSGLILSLLLLIALPASAQQDANTFVAEPQTQSGTEEIALTVGDILEVLPSTDLQSPVYSWILTQDRTFQQAGRSETFRYRFIQPGTYSLIAEIQAGDQSAAINRIFTITAKARERGDTGVPDTSGDTETDSNLTGIVKPYPAMDLNQRVILGNNQQLLKLSPIDADVKPLSLDLDTTKDSDNDGNPSNDIDNKNTFFQLYAEPLYVWFASPISSKKLAVTTVGTDGAARVQQIEVSSLENAQQAGQIVSPIRIQSESKGNGVYEFMAEALEGSTQEMPLLYHWTFGDGEESLIMNPSHTFAADGTYTVSLKVRNLVDGQDIAQEDLSLEVIGVGTTGAGASTSSQSSVPAGTTESGNGWPIMTILLALGIFLLFAALGVGVVFLFSRFRGGKSLDQTFAEMEKNIVAKDDAAKNPPTLAIPTTATVAKPATPAAPAPTKEEISRREENAASNSAPAATPRIDEKAAPEWLKKGLDPVKPAATPMPSTPAPVAPPVPKPASTPAAPAASATPPWLQKGPVTPPASMPAPQTPAPVVPPAAPKPQPPVATPAVAPAAPATAPVPSWLKQPATTPAATVTKPAAPTPPAPKPAPVQPPVPAAPAFKPPVPQTPAPVAAPVPAPAPKPSIPQVPSAAPIAVKPVAPVVPAPVAQPKPTAPTPAPVMPPQVQTPVTPAVPAPKPTAPAPTPAPSQTQTPATPVAPKPTAPAPAPAAPVMPPAPKPFVPAPVTPPAPKPFVPAPQTPAPAVPPAPKPVTPAAPSPVPVPSVPVPVMTPAPIQPPAAPAPKQEQIIQQKPAAPVPAPTIPTQKELEQTDLPIAFIRADSLDTGNNQQS